MSIELSSAECADLKIKEMTQLIVEGKVGINELMKTIADSIVPVKKTRKPYIRNGKPKMTDDEKREHQKQYRKQYYEKNKEKRAQEYEQHKEILNNNQKKYYRLRALCKELKGKMGAKITPMSGPPIREFRRMQIPDDVKEN